MELKWTATRISATTTRLQVVGSFVPEKRMLGVAGIIKNATHEARFFLTLSIFLGSALMMSLVEDPWHPG